jgi:predicted Ser/Thr protein kinase
MTPPVPTKIGRYAIVEHLGQGGMGVVYLATDPALGRTVAIKMLTEDNAELRERFAGEARSAAALKHNNIVTIYDVGQDDGRPFIAMEFLDGETMADVIRRGAPLPIGRKLQLVIELCAGLGYAHRCGIVHRDIKPANLIITRDGTLKILDFGIARVTAEATDRGLTRAGALVGSFHYMSPEQAEGLPVDERSDIFSVGLVLYELLSSQRAFSGDSSPVVLHRIVNNKPRPIRELCPDMDSDLERIVNTALAKNPAARYQTLGPLAADLRRQLIAAEEALPLQEVAPTVRVERSRERKVEAARRVEAAGMPWYRRLAVVVPVGVLLVSALISLGWWALHRPQLGPVRPLNPAADYTRTMADAETAYEVGNASTAVSLALSVPDGAPERQRAVALLTRIRVEAATAARASRQAAAAAGAMAEQEFLDGDAKLKTAEALTALPDTELASRTYRDADRAFASAVSAGWSAERFVQEARRLYGAGDVEGAIEKALQALTRDRGNQSAVGFLADRRLEAGKLATASRKKAIAAGASEENSDKFKLGRGLERVADGHTAARETQGAVDAYRRATLAFEDAYLQVHDAAITAAALGTQVNNALQRLEQFIQAQNATAARTEIDNIKRMDPKRPLGDWERRVSALEAAPITKGEAPVNDAQARREIAEAPLRPTSAPMPIVAPSPGVGAAPPVEGEVRFVVQHTEGRSGHSGTLRVSPGRITWLEAGPRTKPEDNFSISCSEIVDVGKNTFLAGDHIQTRTGNYNFLPSILNLGGFSNNRIPGFVEAISKACPGVVKK